MTQPTHWQDPAQDQQPASPATFSDSHADLLDLFGLWEVLADSDSDPRVETAPTASYSGAVQPR